MLLRVLHSSFLPRRFVSRRQFCSQPPKDIPSQEKDAKKLEGIASNATSNKKALDPLQRNVDIFKSATELFTKATDKMRTFKAAWAFFSSNELNIKKNIRSIMFGIYHEVNQHAKTELKDELSADAKKIYETKKLELKQEADRVEKSTKENLTDFVTKEEETFKTKFDSYTSGKEAEFKENIQNESINELNQFNADMQRTTEIKRDEIKDFLISWVSKSNSDLESKANELSAKLEIITKESHASCFDEAQEKYNQYFAEKDQLYEQFFESNREVFETFFKKHFEDFETFFAENRKKTLNEILTDYVSRRTDFENYLMDKKEKFDSYFEEINKNQKNHFDTVTNSITSLHSNAKESLETTRDEGNAALETKGKVLKKQVGRNALIANIFWFIILNVFIALCIILMDCVMYKYYIESVLEDSLDALIFFEDFEKRIDSSYIDYLIKNNDFSGAMLLKALSFLMTYKFFAALFLRSKSEGGVQLCIGILGVLCSDYEVALRAFDQVLESNESNSKQTYQASYGKAYIFLKQKKFQGALDLINTTLHALQNSNSDHKLRIRCLILHSNILYQYQTKNHKKAIELLIDLLKDPFCEDLYQITIYKKLGDYYYSDGEYKKAERAYNASNKLSRSLLSTKLGKKSKPSILYKLKENHFSPFEIDYRAIIFYELEASFLSSFEIDYAKIISYELEASLLATKFHLIEEDNILDPHQKKDKKEALREELYEFNKKIDDFEKNIASKLLVLNDLFKINLPNLGITTDYEYAVLNKEIFDNSYDKLKEFGWKVNKDPILDLNGKIHYYLLHHPERKEYLYIFTADASYNEILESLLQNRAGGRIVSTVINDIQSNNKDGVKITFTGYAFGALYAEYLNWKINESPDAYQGAQFECITFNSPGSAGIIRELTSRNTSNVNQDISDNFARSTRIYLPSPDRINTTNQQAVNPVHVFTPFKYSTRGLNWVVDCILSALYYFSGKWFRPWIMKKLPDSRQQEVFTLDQIIDATFDKETGKVKQTGDYPPVLIKRWPKGSADFIEYLDIENRVPSEVCLKDGRIDFTPAQQNAVDRIYCSESERYKYNISSLQELSPEILSYLRAYVKTNGAIDKDADSRFLQFSIQSNQIELHSGISISEFKRYIQFRIGKIGEDKLMDYKTNLFQAQYFTEHYGMLLSRTIPVRDNEDIPYLSTANNIKLEKHYG